MIAIIDYGAGNLHSVINAVKKLGYETEVTSDGSDLLAARAVILPGVGAAGDTMQVLDKMRLINPVRQYIAAGRPFLGICIGLQILFTHTEEGGGSDCLDIIKGKVRRLPEGQKVPQIGWNQVKYKTFHKIFDGIPDNTNFYFVHSYFADPIDKKLVIGETDYGVTFCSAVARDNLVAVQFHPEKSGDAGLHIYDNFIKQAIQ